MKKETRGIGNLFTDGEFERNSILDLVSDAICQFSIDGALTYVNQAFCDLFNKTNQELLGANYFELVSAERRANIESKYSELAPGLRESFLEFIGEAPGGGSKWRHWVDQGIFDHNVQLTEILASGRIIDDQAIPGLASERYKRGLSALIRATTAILKTLDLESLLGKILDAAIGAIPNAESGMLHLIAEGNGHMNLQEVLGTIESDSRIQKNIPDESSYISQVVRNRSAARVDKIAVGDPHHPGKKLPRRHKSAIAAPLLYQNHILGVLSLEASSAAAFTNIDLGLLVNFANVVTTAIHNAQLQVQVEKLALTDELTGLLNRKGFFDLGEREIERAIRYKRPLAILLIDIDDFKQLNDSLGHDIGDQILRYVGKIAHNNTRNVDICGRYGGDDIAILLPETDLFTGASVAHRLHNYCSENPMKLDNKHLEFTVSIGVAKLTSEVTDLENLMKRADSALLAAKDGGRNRVEIR